MSLCVIEIGWDCDDSVLDLLTQEVLSDFFHFDEDHGGDLFRGVGFGLILDQGLDVRFSVFVHDVVREILFVVLNGFVGVFSPDESLHVVQGSGWVDGSLVLCGFSDQSFFVGEGHDGWGNSVS